MNRKTITITLVASLHPLSSWMRVMAAVLLAGVIVPKALAGGSEEISAGFAFDRFQLTLDEGWRTEAVGPFFYSEHSESNRLWAIPPFFSHWNQPAIESTRTDFLYPLFTDIHYGHESRWQFFQLLGASAGDKPDDGNAKQFNLFPIYFQQRAPDTNLNYTAVVPFYGTIKNRLFRDRIHFVMMPFYVETQKRDVVVDNYFWPFVDTHHGDGMKGWQFWPFVGREHKVVTTQTNGFGDVTSIAGHDHSFYVWPLYLRQDNGIGTDNPEKLRASIPFYVSSHSPQRDATSMLWPFFTVIDDRNRKYHEWQGPWPFVIWTRGEGKHTSRVWPIFSRSRNGTGTQEVDSYVWPLYMYSHLRSEPLDRTRTRVAFYLYSRIEEKNLENGESKIRLDMWPFFTWKHDLNGNERLQVFAPIEPAVPHNTGIEHDWSPLWSVWRAEKNPRTGASSQSLLWNLYRHDVTPTEKNVSVLFGLFQHRSDAEKSRTKLFYFTVFQTPHKR